MVTMLLGTDISDGSTGYQEWGNGTPPTSNDGSDPNYFKPSFTNNTGDYTWDLMWYDWSVNYETYSSSSRKIIGMLGVIEYHTNGTLDASNRAYVQLYQSGTSVQVRPYTIANDSVSGGSSPFYFTIDNGKRYRTIISQYSIHDSGTQTASGKLHLAVIKPDGNVLCTSTVSNAFAGTYNRNTGPWLRDGNTGFDGMFEVYMSDITCFAGFKVDNNQDSYVRVSPTDFLGADRTIVDSDGLVRRNLG